MQIFQDLMPSLRFGRWAPSALRKHLFGEETESLESLCRMMMDSDGEYSSMLLAERVLNAYEKLDDAGRIEFFNLLHREFDIDVGEIRAAIEAYESSPDAANLVRVTSASEPARQELLRRIKARFDELGIERPFPQQTVRHCMENGSGIAAPGQSSLADRHA